MNFFRSNLLRFLLPLLLVVAGAVLCSLLVPAEEIKLQQQISGFPDTYVPAQQARPYILGAMCFLPALAAFAYCCGGTLDRYISRQFAVIFALCLATLVMIWLLIDIADKIADFRETGRPLNTMLRYYAARSPAVLMSLLPYSLLLSLLYSLGKFSSNREVVAMIQSGRSVIRLTFPLMIAGLLCSALSMGLNYHWAAAAGGDVGELLPDTDGKHAVATNVLFRDPLQNRLWSIGEFPRNYQLGEALRNVEITTTRADKTLESRLTATRALWDRETHRWTFEHPAWGTYAPGQPGDFKPIAGDLTIDTWPETPWQLIKPGLSADALDVPDLETWLRANSKNGNFADPAPYLTQWHYRWALPLTCLVTVLLATPLAVHFSRRGPGGGVFVAVVLSGLLLLVTNISMALGESGAIRPMHAAWLPNLAFAVLGLYLFHRRLTGQPIYLVLRRLFPGND